MASVTANATTSHGALAAPVELLRVSKTYGGFKAVDDITFVDSICPDGTNSEDSEDGACGVTAVSER